MTYKISNFDLKDIQKPSTTAWNPILSISELPYHDAKKVMSEVYNHELTEEDYLLMPTAESPLDFFRKVKEGEEKSILQKEGRT